MTATLPTLEVIAPAPAEAGRLSRPLDLGTPPADRLKLLQQMAECLQAAVAQWAEDTPGDICRRAQDLEILRAQFGAAPAAAVESEAQAAELLRALAVAAREVRRFNDLYMTLLRAAQRGISLSLRHLSAYAPVYAPGIAAGPAAAGATALMESLLWERPAREVRA